MPRPKLSVLWMLILLPVFLLSSCAKSKDGDGAEALRLFYSPMDMSNPYFRSLANGMKDRAAELGLILEISDPVSNPEKQIADLNAALEEEYDILICSPLRPEDCTAVAEAARKKNVPFINPNQTVPGSVAHINLDDFEYGRMGGRIAGTWIKEKLPPRSEVLIIGYDGMEALGRRAEGIRRGILEEAPDARIAGTISALTPEAGMVETEKALREHPDISVIAAVNDAAALGAMTAVGSLAEIPEDFCIVGLDATSESIERMKRPNTIFRGTVDIDPYGTGILIIDTALRVRKDGPLKEMVRIGMKPVYWDGRE